MVDFSIANRQPFRLVADSNGRHHFGGAVDIAGLTPTGATVPVQHVISFDLGDARIPIENGIGAQRLPLFYPFKYGCGGPDMQYDVRSDNEISILHMSDPEPDEPDGQYLQVDTLPNETFRIEPFTYEEARILGFFAADAHFQPNDADNAILDALDINHLAKVGGYHPHITNVPDLVCKNPDCECNGSKLYFDLLLRLPPIPIRGDDEFWYEFQGAHMSFCFGLCRCCGTVIAFNVCS